jgi:sugar/nucleoside kinase (ribokinase family)
MTLDLYPEHTGLGGTVVYSTLTARALGKRPGIVTRYAPELTCPESMKDIPVIHRTSLKTTTFNNSYSSSGRKQILHSVADPITPDMVPHDWRSSSIVHLGPVANEVDPEIVRHLRGKIVGLTPQGWHRGWDSKGNVFFKPWPRAKDILPSASIVIVSREDIMDEDTWRLYKKYCRILVITEGSKGCLVRYRNEERHFPSPEYEEIDPTGVGDIFASAFFIKMLDSGGDPWEAARFANCIAAPTVTRRGLDSIPTEAEVGVCLQGRRSG